MRNAITALMLAVVLVACGGGGYNDLDAAIAGEDCTVSSHGTEKMFATDEVHCDDGTMISWHNSEMDRNAYAEFVEGFLDVTPDEKGEWYLIYRS